MLAAMTAAPLRGFLVQKYSPAYFSLLAVAVSAKR